MLFTTLPSDILILVFQYVSIQDLGALSAACSPLNFLVTQFGWTVYLRARRARPSFSLSQSRKGWESKAQVRYDFLTDLAWGHRNFIARPLSRPWVGKMQPILAINASRLVIAAGPNLFSYKFGASVHGISPPIFFDGSFSFAPSQHNDITGLALDDESEGTINVGLHDGTLHRVSLRALTPELSLLPSGATTVPISHLREGDFVECLSSERNLLLVLSANGSAYLTSSHSATSAEVVLGARGWVSHLCLDASSPFAAFGTSSTCPLRVHPILNDELSQTPTAILHTNMNSDFLTPISTAVYGISRAPLASPWGASPQIIVSGWFDGRIRCHDLRSSSRILATEFSQGNPAPLRPVLVMKDPYQLEAVYSVSCGGGSSSHIAAGTARHSVVSFWDIRSPKTGWSVHAPGNDRSPVYSIILESSRLFGATQSRPFVYDFGPGVDVNTYPSLPEGRGVDGLKKKRGDNQFSYFVTKYRHHPETF